MSGTHYASLHELTCIWAAYQYKLSLDSTRLPTYVRPVGDSLQLNEEVLAYSVEMAAPEDLDHRDLYFVAEVGDSLFFEDIQRIFSDGNPESVTVRSIRPFDVEGAESQYIWYEYAKISKGKGDPPGIYEMWEGHIFTYDPRRGMRYLHKAPVRAEARTGDEVNGVTQWDVSVPEPGIMKVEPRLKKGADVKLGPREWLGKHVIDATVTPKREMDLKGDASNRTFVIDTTEVDNWREKYEKY